MNPREFIEKHKNDIVAEPSGRTYAEISDDRAKHYVLIDALLNK